MNYHEAINAGLAEACGCSTTEPPSDAFGGQQSKWKPHVRPSAERFYDSYYWEHPDGWSRIVVYVDGRALFYKSLADPIDSPLFDGELCDPHLVTKLQTWAERIE